jgi:predicted membrane-bound spermidine synthase
MPSTARCAAIAFLVSLALLDAQVTATRLIAYRFFYHFVFFVVSLAQLGLAAAGAWVYASRRAEWRAADLARWLVALAALPLVFLACYAWLGPPPNLSFGKVDGSSAYAYLTALALALVALNFCGGMALTLVFTSRPREMGRLYAADLAGAALGCAASVGLMLAVGPIRAFLGAGLAALVAAALSERMRAGGALAALGLTAGMLFPGVFDPYVALPEIQKRIARFEWNHLARTDAMYAGRYVIDGDASTDVREDLETLPVPEYQLVRRAPDVAVLGVGAGPQLRMALQMDAASVLAIDINPTILRWDQVEDRDANRGIFHDPRVSVELGEARHLLRSTPRDFDLVVMHAIDTWTASAQGAYSLSENFLYTSEAMRDLLGKLRPGGVVSIRRWQFWPPRETLRLFTTVLDALQRAGAARPESQVVVLSPSMNFRSPELHVWGFVLFSNLPIEDERLARLDAYVAQRGWAYLYRPGSALDTPFSEYARSPDRHAFLASYPYIVSPSSDSNPFFFQFTLPWSTWSGPQAVSKAVYAQSSQLLLLCLVVTAVLTGVLLGTPLWLRRADVRGDRALAPALAYFAALGVGFMGFELPAIQIMTLFLGHPTYALSVVLAGLLAGAGIGSTWMGRAPLAAGRVAVGVVIGLALACGAGLLPAVHALIQLPASARLALTAVTVVGLGIPLGMPLVGGVRLLDPDRPELVAWAWAANGAAAVVGSCLLMVVMVYGGSGAAFGVAAGAYALAAVARRWLATPDFARTPGMPLR